MCGRTACTLSKDQLRMGCTLTAGKVQPPNWRHLPCSPEYSPGYNQPPGKFLPVLYCDPTGSPGSRLISTMKWGLVPSWVGRDASGFSMHMSNARVETLMEKASFRNLVLKGRRCVLLCEGFYEWKRPKLGSAGAKQAYFFHPPGWVEHNDKQQQPNLMFIAALFDVHKELPGKPDLYSFTVITVHASDVVSEIHDRMPAILQTADQISTWLQADDAKQAIACLQSVTDICFYAVSSHVNSTQHNDKLCLQPVKVETGAPVPTALDKWLPKPSSTCQPSGSKQQQLQQQQSQNSPRKRPHLPDTGLTRWIRSGTTSPTEVKQQRQQKKKKKASPSLKLKTEAATVVDEKQEGDSAAKPTIKKRRLD